MPKTLPLERVNEDKSSIDPSAVLQIRDKLLRKLGEPTGLFRVQVKSLWGDFYRANVFVGTFSDSKVAHSYFLKATPDGEIVTSVPPLKREY